MRAPKRGCYGYYIGDPIKEPERLMVTIQTGEIARWAAIYDYIPVTFYSDASPELRNAERKGLGELVGAIKDGVLVVYSLQYLSKSITDVRNLIYHLKTKNSRLVAIADKFDTGYEDCKYSGELVSNINNFIQDSE